MSEMKERSLRVSAGNEAMMLSERRGWGFGPRWLR